jgi:hypothetical protein
MTWRPVPLNKLRRKAAKAAKGQQSPQICSGSRICRQGRKTASDTLSLLQPALTSEKQKILLIQFILIN